MASVLPTTIGCTDAHASVLPVLPTEELSGLILPIFSLSSLEPKSLRMVILTIILVQVLCCLYQSPKHYIEIWHERPFSLHRPTAVASRTPCMWPRPANGDIPAPCPPLPTAAQLFFANPPQPKYLINQPTPTHPTDGGLCMGYCCAR